MPKNEKIVVKILRKIVESEFSLLKEKEKKMKLIHTLRRAHIVLLLNKKT